jgi:hypothetical protein
MFSKKIVLRLKICFLLTGFVILTGCASEPPKEALSKAETAIQDAERSGASNYEPALLSSARAKLVRANQDADDEEIDEARRLAEEAHAEAVLAIAKAEAAKQAQQTEEMKKTIGALRQETTRESGSQ